MVTEHAGHLVSLTCSTMGTAEVTQLRCQAMEEVQKLGTGR